ncbi:hypothetical protein Agub_g1030, partial [Astrephomene gubernaculifera]
AAPASGSGSVKAAPAGVLAFTTWSTTSSSSTMAGTAAGGGAAGWAAAEPPPAAASGSGRAPAAASSRPVGAINTASNANVPGSLPAALGGGAPGPQWQTHGAAAGGNSSSGSSRAGASDWPVGSSGPNQPLGSLQPPMVHGCSNGGAAPAGVAGGAACRDAAAGATWAGGAGAAGVGSLAVDAGSGTGIGSVSGVLWQGQGQGHAASRVSAAPHAAAPSGDPFAGLVAAATTSSNYGGGSCGRGAGMDTPGGSQFAGVGLASSQGYPPPPSHQPYGASSAWLTSPGTGKATGIGVLGKPAGAAAGVGATGGQSRLAVQAGAGGSNIGPVNLMDL